MPGNNLSHSNRIYYFVLFAQLWLFSPISLADARIGLVKTHQPIAYVIRQSVKQKLLLGAEIFQGDTIETDASGAVGIIFNDGAVLTLGSDSKLILDNFLFKPDERKVSFLTRVLKGSLVFVSGAIGRISPESVHFKTPTATLGLRGTKVLIDVQ